MSQKVVISYAYRGFAYIPLFLAYDLGYFPQGVELKYTNGDEEALASMLGVGTTEASDFSICDPLIVSNLKALIGKKERQIEHPLVIGSLINTLPAWVFNPSSNVHPVLNESELSQYNISKVRCYKSPNTGYLIGLRLLKKLNLPHDQEHLLERSFEKEFEETVQDDEVLVTSDILRMGELGFNNNNIVFSYADRHTDIQRMFFTGLLTTKTLFSNNLPLVLGVLSGVKKAVHRLNHDDDVDRISKLAHRSLKTHIIDQGGTPFATTFDDSAQESIVKTTITEIIRKEHIYSSSLEIRKDDWDVSIRLRKGVFNTWTEPEYNAYTQTIPVILIHPGWPDRIQVKESLEPVEPREATEPPPIDAPQRFHAICNVLVWVLNIWFMNYCIRGISEALTHTDPNLTRTSTVVFVTVVCTAVLGLSISLSINTFWRKTVKHYWSLMLAWVGTAASAWSIVGGLSP